MPKKKYPPEKIIGMLREAELTVNQGKRVVEACRKIGVIEQTCYLWKEYGGMGLELGRAQTGVLYKNYLRSPDRAVKLCRVYVDAMFGETGSGSRRRFERVK